jgi:hypothetical protein
MKSNNRWQKVGPIQFRDICWPVKIRVRAEPPQMAPRVSPVFPVSPFSNAAPMLSESSVLPLRRLEADSPPAVGLRLSRRVELYDWRVMGEQDERWEC